LNLLDSCNENLPKKEYSPKIRTEPVAHRVTLVETHPADVTAKAVLGRLH